MTRKVWRHTLGRRLGRQRSRGFTLLELLVAMAILSLLGASLIVVLRGGLATWRRGEARRESFEMGQAVLRQLETDLSTVTPPYDTPLSSLGEVEHRLLSDFSADFTQRLFLTRSITAESENPITGLAGNSILANSDLDYRNDLDEARYEQLRATGGAQEVAWVLKDGILYRGIKAPIGPPNSLFDADHPYDLAGVDDVAGEDDGTSTEPLFGAPALLRPFATNVIHFELRFWTQYTNTFDVSQPCRRDPGSRASGPLTYWDSTRGALDVPVEDPGHFKTFVSGASRTDPRDDILPMKVLVTIVFEEHDAAGTSTYLTKKLEAGDETFTVQEGGRLNKTGGFVRVGQEWIRYESASPSSGRVTIADDGRGARNTLEENHPAETPVVYGRTFTTVIGIPAYREDWSER